MDRRVDETCASPPEMLDHKCTQRPANRAGKTAKERQAGDRPARFAAIHPAECGENRIIKASAHSEANEHPGEQINRQCMRQTNKREACGIEQRTCQQDWSSAADIDNAANLRRDQACSEKTDRCPPDHKSERPA